MMVLKLLTWQIFLKWEGVVATALANGGSTGTLTFPGEIRLTSFLSSGLVNVYCSHHPAKLYTEARIPDLSSEMLFPSVGRKHLEI